MKILVIGQCTLHWGRMEFGNIGNYYVIEPFFRELHRCFPRAEIRTTMQMSEGFCNEEKVCCLPMELYYAWRRNELDLARAELRMAEALRCGGATQTTPYIDAIHWADLVIDYSGDIWGDNANFLGADRFEVGLIKDMVAQNLGKPTVLIAGSPGPFSNSRTRELAKTVYANFRLVTNRESISTELLKYEGFDTERTASLACPAFLFEAASKSDMAGVLLREGISPDRREKPLVGFVLCGWNFEKGPFDRWPRDDADYNIFAECVELITRDFGATVCLLSHSNGFDVPPAPFRLRHGRDYPIAKQLQNYLSRRGIAKDVICLDGIYDPWQTKGIIGVFDMLVSGRVHAAVAGMSQSVPTVIVDYGHEPKAHKVRGFSAVAEVDAYVADPSCPESLSAAVHRCWDNRTQLRRHLSERMPLVRELARQNFALLKEIVG